MGAGTASQSAARSQYVFCGGTGYDIRAFSLDDDRDYGELRARWRGLGREPPPEAFCVGTLRGHSGQVLALATDPTGTVLASGSEDFSVRLWRLRFEGDGRLFPPADPDSADAGGPGTGLGLGLGASRRRGSDQGRRLLRPAVEVNRHDGHVTGVAFSQATGADSCFLASCSTDHSVAVWRLAGAGSGPAAPRLQPVWFCPGAHESVVSSICWGRGEESGSTLFSCGWDATIKVWGATMPADGKDRTVSGATRTLRGHETRVASCSVSLDGVHLVSVSSDCKALLWRAGGGFELLCAYSFPGPVSAVVAANDFFVTGSESGMIIVWPVLCDEHRACFDASGDVEAVARRKSRGSMVASGRRTSSFSLSSK
jgi:WD40 repeat protein